MVFSSPDELAGFLETLFPAFINELEDEEIESFHQVLARFAPIACERLGSARPSARGLFCEAVNVMYGAGGAQQNAVITAFLEHASQIGVSKLIRPLLSVEARSEMR